MIYFKTKHAKNICLNYHAFSGSKTNDNIPSKYTIDFDIFKQQLDLLREKQNLELHKLMLNPSSDFSYSLTFDDGYKSHLQIAEELAKRNLKGTFYIITNEIAINSRYLDKKEIKEIDSLGMEIGSHTCSHRHVNRLTTKDMINELHDSKYCLEDILSKQVESISYPGGHFSQREFNQAIKEGYKNQRTCISGLNSLPIKNQLIKCYNIKDYIDINYFNLLIGPNPSVKMLVKLREIGLIIPKFIHSYWQIRQKQRIY